MKRLIKSKLFWIAAAYVCIFVVALVFAINAEPEAAPCEEYNCSFLDILHNEKFNPNVYIDATYKNNLSDNDQMSLFLYFDHELSDDEILQVEQIGLKINKDSWIPTESGDFFYGAKCPVKNICKLACLDIVKRVTSAESYLEPLY
jgi:hypothetical protein